MARVADGVDADEYVVVDCDGDDESVGLRRALRRGIVAGNRRFPLELGLKWKSRQNAECGGANSRRNGTEEVGSVRADSPGDHLLFWKFQVASSGLTDGDAGLRSWPKKMQMLIQVSRLLLRLFL